MNRPGQRGKEKKTMKIHQCRQCSFFVEAMADCTVCIHGNDMQHRVVFQGSVVSCPRDARRR